jgi:hypothetical protein
MRPHRLTSRVALTALFVAALHAAVPASLAAQVGTYTVSGRVIERGTEQGIAQAAVRLGEDYSALTNENGEFEMRRVRPGRYPLTVEALGWGTVQTILAVTEDVTGIIRMDPAPIPLDTLGVRPARFTLSGRIVEAANGRAVPFVTVETGAGATSSNDGGFFRLRNLARGPNPVRVEGFGWLPFRTQIDINGDTSVTVALERDPIMDRIIAAHIDTLSKRVVSVGNKLREIDRSTILDSRAPTPVSLLQSVAQVRIVDCPDPERSRREFAVSMSSINVCIHAGHPPAAVRPIVFIDERRVCGLEVFDVYPNAMFERIEVLSDGREVRAYTTTFLERMIAHRAVMHPFTPFERPLTC